MKHLSSLSCLKTNDLEHILDLCKKAEENCDIFQSFLKNKTIGAFFQRPSTRMRFSLETAINQMGGSTIFFKTSDTHLSRDESIADTARTLSSYLDAIVIRARSQQDIDDFIDFGNIPVLNGMSTMYYPVMAICSLYTIRKKMGRLKGLNLAFVGDGNNICHSLMIGAALMGLNITVITPPMYEPSPLIVDEVEDIAKDNGIIFNVSNNLNSVENADIIFTDVWISMGMEDESKERLKAFKKYQVNNSLIEKTKKKPIILHPMPIRRGEEITSDLVNNSMIFENAGNMIFVIKAILYYLIKEESK